MMQKKSFKLSLYLQPLIIILMLLIQILLLVFITWKFAGHFTEFYFIFMVLSITVILMAANSNEHPDYKLAIVIPIAIFPVFGGLFYLIFSRNRMKKLADKFKERLLHEEQKAFALLPTNTSLPDNQSAFLQFNYIQNAGGYPVCQNTCSQYFCEGEELFTAMKREMRKAQHYIFLEYFIIAEGIMWDETLAILREKVAQGVDVRIIYDGMGCVNTLPYKYYEVLRAYGIHCEVFNPFIPVASILHNNRDHRKIMIIDGHTAFTGGINIADEYINAISPHGHWKDTGIMLKGDAAWSFTLMFLSMWSALANVSENYAGFRPPLPPVNSRGLVQPFNDIPFDYLQLSRDAYLNMIYRAQKSVFIMTPYFIVDNETLIALCMAARSGVEVQIITPHVSDSWYVHMMTRSYYKELLESGVKVFEYTPGFIHAKNIICDGELAICGSINFDYRSFYLQMECGVLLYRTEAVEQMQKDFLETRQLCQIITAGDYRQDKWYEKFLLLVLRLFSPLM